MAITFEQERRTQTAVNGNLKVPSHLGVLVEAAPVSTCKDRLYHALGIEQTNPVEGINQLFPPGFQYQDIAVGTIEVASRLRTAWRLDEPTPIYTPSEEKYEEALVALQIDAEKVLVTRDTTEASQRESDGKDRGRIENYLAEQVFRLRMQIRPAEKTNDRGEKIIVEVGITDNGRIAAGRSDRNKMMRLYQKRQAEQPSHNRASTFKVGDMFEIFPGEEII